MAGGGGARADGGRDENSKAAGSAPALTCGGAPEGDETVSDMPAFLVVDPQVCERHHRRRQNNDENRKLEEGRMPDTSHPAEFDSDPAQDHVDREGDTISGTNGDMRTPNTFISTKLMPGGFRSIRAAD